jgi:hypothetical protein
MTSDSLTKVLISLFLLFFPGYSLAQTTRSSPPISWEYTTTQGTCKTGNNTQGHYLTVHYSNFAYTDPSSGTVTALSGTVTGYYLESGCISFPGPGTPKPSPDPLVLSTPGGKYDFYATGLGNGTIQLAPSPITGYVNPKYVVVGVTYAPPGPSSSVTYTGSTLVGNTTTTSSSFQSDVNVTVTVTRDISAWSIVGGAAVKIANTASTDSTQGSNSSSTVTVSKTTTASYQTKGTANACAPVNHDYDTIWLWLNPLLIYTLDPNVPSSLTWNGYGYDNHDPSGVGGRDIFPVQVGWLNGDFGDDPSIDNILARGWVTQYENITWPVGEGPGLTSADKADILAADPFTNPAYTLPSPLPLTSADDRFTQDPYPPNPVAYVPGGLTTSYGTVNVNTQSTSNGTSYTYKQAFGTDVSFSGGNWLAHLTVDIKTTDTLTWSYSWLDTLTTTQTNTNALSVTEPSGCNPPYAGPGQFVVYQDNKYGTFMFYPAN